MKNLHYVDCTIKEHEISKWDISEFSDKLEEHLSALLEEHGLIYSQIVDGPRVSMRNVRVDQWDDCPDQALVITVGISQ